MSASAPDAPQAPVLRLADRLTDAGLLGPLLALDDAGWSALVGLRDLMHGKQAEGWQSSPLAKSPWRLDKLDCAAGLRVELALVPPAGAGIQAAVERLREEAAEPFRRAAAKAREEVLAGPKAEAVRQADKRAVDARAAVLVAEERVRQLAQQVRQAIEAHSDRVDQLQDQQYLAERRLAQLRERVEPLQQQAVEARQQLAFTLRAEVNEAVRSAGLPVRAAEARARDAIAAGVGPLLVGWLLQAIRSQIGDGIGDAFTRLPPVEGGTATAPAIPTPAPPPVARQLTEAERIIEARERARLGVAESGVRVVQVTPYERLTTNVDESGRPLTPG